MSNDPVFSYLQVLDSINELRQTIASESGGYSTGDMAHEATFWETPADRWFEDCEFDPRLSTED